MNEEGVLLNLERPDAGDRIREFLIDLGRVIKLRRRVRRRLRRGIPDDQEAKDSYQEYYPSVSMFQRSASILAVSVLEPACRTDLRRAHRLGHTVEHRE